MKNELEDSPSNFFESSFSKSANSYDGFAEVQAQVAKDLSELAAPSLCPKISVLEIGCGTGALTKLLLESEENLNLTCQDFSSSMLEKLESKMRRKNSSALNLVCLDMDKGIASGSYSLIVSSSCFHWSRNLPALFKNLNKELEQSGEIYFSMMIKGTFLELEREFSDVLENEIEFDYQSKEQIERVLLEAGFKINFSNDRNYFEFYPNFNKFLASLKKRGVLKFRDKSSKEAPFILPKKLLRIGEKYESRATVSSLQDEMRELNLSSYQKIYARYKVLICHATKELS